jgi:hypothetical protein
MTVFDNRERNDDAPKARTEGLIAFYDRSSRRSMDVFRDLINQWAGDLLSESATDVVARLRSGDDLNFGTAFAELLMDGRLATRARPRITVGATCAPKRSCAPSPNCAPSRQVWRRRRMRPPAARPVRSRVAVRARSAKLVQVQFVELSSIAFHRDLGHANETSADFR